MIRWIEIRGTPLRQIHMRDALPYLDQSAHRHQILASIGNLRSAANGEIPNLSFVTKNADCESTAILSRPQIGDECAVMAVEDGAIVEQFVGVLQRPQLGEQSVTWDVRA